jgi:SNF2 family DNA or RNA helicase
MKLFTILSTSTEALIATAFKKTVITKALRLVKKQCITSIDYNQEQQILKMILDDEVVQYQDDLEQYSVVITISSTNAEALAAHCSCQEPGRKNSMCEHIAASLILMVNYFCNKPAIDSNAQNYYHPLLFTEFENCIKPVEDQHIPENINTITFTKPTIIFFKYPDSIYPRLLFIDDKRPHSNIQKRSLIAKLKKTTLDNLDSVLEDTISYKEEFDYFAYLDKGIVPLTLAKNHVTPFWQLQKNGEHMHARFMCKNDTQTFYNGIPLGQKYIIDLDNLFIRRLKVAHKKKYTNFWHHIVAMADEKFTKTSIIPSGLTLKAIDVPHFIKTEHTLKNSAPLTISLATLDDRFSHYDENLLITQHHLSLIDEQCLSIKITDLPITKRIKVRGTFGSSNLYFSGYLHGTNTFDVQASSFALEVIDLLITSIDKTTNQAQRTAITQGIIDIIQKLDSPVTNRDTYKKIFLNNKSFGTPEERKVMFTKLTDLWERLGGGCFYKLGYHSTAHLYQQEVFYEKELVLLVLDLVHCALLHGTKIALITRPQFSIEADATILPHVVEYFNKKQIALYMLDKKIIRRSLNIEIDVNNSGDNWFSISPQFYEKNVLLKKEEWEILLNQADQNNLRETEEGIEFIDLPTLNILNSLRSIKKEYEEKKNSSDAINVPRLHIFTLLSLIKSGARLKTSDEDKKIIEGLHNFKVMPALALPEGLTCSLRDYQVQGYDWLGFLYEHRFGACLADEMGLGKTVQTIAFLAGLHEQKMGYFIEGKKTHLIIGPATVIGNWESEIKKFYPSLKTELYVGNQRSLGFDRADVIISTYDTIRNDINDLKKFLFDVIVFDEAQAIKNQESQKAHATFQLNARFKVCLTGTPLENNVKELCSIMKLALPGLLPNEKQVETLVKQGAYQVLHEKIAPFILRRTKKEYLQELPPKTEYSIYLEMDKKQKGIYGAIVDEIKGQVYEAYREKTNAQANIIVLTALLRLRQICITPELLNKQFTSASPKIDHMIREIKRHIKEQVPHLVFSQFTSALDILEKRLQECNITYVRIDGSINTLQRKKIIDEFQQNNTIFVFLLSLKTGGVGLNLTRARVVYHLDPWWNPAIEDQASDRVHRIGQQHEVQIIRLIMKDSIEEKMIIFKQKKKDLFNAIMAGASGSLGSAITKQDFEFLLG